MRNETAKLDVFGHKLTTNQLSAGLLIFSVVVGVCSLVGLEMISCVLMAGAALSILVWAVQLIEPAASPAERFTQLRQLVRARRSSESENTTLSDIPRPVVLFIGCLVVLVNAHHLLNSRQQYAASNYPSVIGLMTRYEMVDVGMVNSALEVQYEYTVGGQKYQGERFRFLYRPYRVGTDDAKQLAAKWGPGARIPVFHEPGNPANAAIDNTFCKGDQLFVGLNAMGMIGVLLVVGCMLYFRFENAVHQRPRMDHDEARNRMVLSLSNVPFYGMFGLTLTGISFGLLIALLVGGFFAMGDGAIPWLVSAIDWMYVVTGGSLCASVACCLAERVCYGRRGRTIEFDKGQNRFVVQPEGLADELTIDLDQIDSIQVVSNREDWFRMGRTFSPAIFYHDKTDSTARIILQRDRNRNQAIHFVSYLKSVIRPAEAEQPVEKVIWAASG